MRILHCLTVLAQAITVSGDVLECGVARGTTAFAMADFLAEMANNKKLYACDTFSGLPYDDSMSGPLMCKAGEMNYGNRFIDILTLRHDQNVVTVKGLVEETLPTQLTNKQFCFAWLDMDLYQPTSFAVKFLHDRITVGGFIGFHDYNFVRCPGIKKVADEELDLSRFKLFLNKDTCAFYQRIK